MTRIVAITVAIAARDRPAALSRCLDAILAGTALPSEIVVVDQSADDAVHEVVVLRAASSPVPLRHIAQRESGLSRSRNAALDAATQPLIAVTDDDCVPDARWVEVLDRELAADAAIAAVSGRVLPLGPDVEGTYAVSSRTSTERREFAGKALPWEVGTGANFVARREWLSRIGGYDVRLGAGSPGQSGEDMDVLYRLLRAGARLRYEPDAVVFHERQPLAQRTRSRFGYGHGIGACCALWGLGGDPFAAKVLARWSAMRLRRLAGAARARDARTAKDELRVLRGTAAGIAYGLRVRRSLRRYGA
ncbi:MAG TPA: glycosyltransferase [Gemmatimonadaceae bacterium]|nr:glycosyltransferase [Gemmatimonadaceae bacterium]